MRMFDLPMTGFSKLVFLRVFFSEHFSNVKLLFVLAQVQVLKFVV